MVPGLSERDARAAELRRRDLLAEAARERRADAVAAGRALPGGHALRGRAGTALVWAGAWLQGARHLGPVGGGSAAALGTTGDAAVR